MYSKTTTKQLREEKKNEKKGFEQNPLNGHTIPNALTNGSQKNSVNANNSTSTSNKNTTCTMINSYNTHSVDANSLPSSSSSLLMPQAYLPKYVEKSLR